MNRRPKGTGTVSKRGAGYIARLVIGHEDGKPIYRTKTTRTKKAAKEALDGWLKQRPSSLEAERTTLEEFAVEWLRHPRNANENTRELRLFALNHVIPRIGHVPLAHIERFHIQHVLSVLRESGVGFAMQTTVFRTLRSLFNHLIDDDVITSSPVRNSDRPMRPRHDEPIRDEPLTEVQVQRLLGEAKRAPETYALYLMAVRLGLREGELLALMCEDIKLQAEEPYLDVRRHLVKSGGSHKIGSFTKIGFARHIVLPKFMVSPLAETLLLRGNRDLLFPAPEGGIYHPKNFYNRNWKRLLKAAGLPHMRFHILRHTATTHALELGENPLIICQRLGWMSPRMLFERYGHVTRRMQIGSAEALDRAEEARNRADSGAERDAGKLG